MARRIFGAVAVLTLVLSACSKSTPTTGGPTTYDVQVDGRNKDVVNSAFTAYFPNSLTAHPGDTVKFSYPVNTGEPHTVTFGTLVDSFVKAAEAQGQNVDESKIPENSKLPDIFPQGPGDANQQSAQPCVLDTGAPQAGATPCTTKTAPDFTGKQAFFNSGYFAESDSFSVKLASDIAPGTYRFMCLVHRSAMTGTLNVAASGATADKPADVTSRGQQSFTQLSQKLKADVAAATAPANTVLAGVADPAIREGFAAAFAPNVISIPVGGTVKWIVFAVHTLGFDAPQSAIGALVKAPDGSVHVNVKAAAPTGGPGPAGPPPSKPVTFDLKSYSGGFRATGFVFSFPPAIVTLEMKFTKAGTYQYVCQIHPDMKGTVKVG